MVRIPILNREEIPDEAVEDAAPEDEMADESADEMAQLSEELAQTKASLLQLAADFENYKRQTARRESEVKDRAVRSVVEDLLPVLDNFQRAVDASKSATDVNSLRIGIEFILQMFQNALQNHGVAPIEAQGKPFDPMQHEALDQVESDEHAPGTVVEEAQRGYTYKGQVLRASSVKVAR